MSMCVSLGCFLPGAALSGRWVDYIINRLKTEGLEPAGLPLRSVIGSDRTFGHFEGAWNKIVFDGTKMVYDPKPDQLHWLAFPNAELTNDWCEMQRLAGGSWSSHELPTDGLFDPHETIELHPKMKYDGQQLTDGRQLHEIIPALAEKNGQQRLVTWDTYHTRRGPWHEQGPWRQVVAPYIGCIHLQPDREVPLDFAQDTTGGTSKVMCGYRQLCREYGVVAPTIIEISPLLLKHLYGWRTLTSVASMYDHVMRYVERARQINSN